MPVNSFKWKHYEGEIILLKHKIVLKIFIKLSKFKKMMIERGIQVDYSTIMKWVHQYFPEIEEGTWVDV